MFKAFKDKTKTTSVSSYFACLQGKHCLTRLHSDIYQFKLLVLLICTNLHFLHSDLWPFLNHALLYNSAEVCKGAVSHQTPFRNLLIWSSCASHWLIYRLCAVRPSTRLESWLSGIFGESESDRAAFTASLSVDQCSCVGCEALMMSPWCSSRQMCM